MPPLKTLLASPQFETLEQILATGGRRLLVVTGAGVSAEVGLPTWPGLRSRLVDAYSAESVASNDPTAASDAAFTAKQLRERTDLWSAFSSLETELPPATYRSVVTQALTPPPGKRSPLMERVWSLPAVAGIASLNLDNIPESSYHRVHPDTNAPTIMTGSEASTDRRVLHQLTTKFVIKLHGKIESRDSWVFTRNDLTRLHRSNGYRDFLKELYQSFLVLFVGISASDYSIGGALRELTAQGGNHDAHYWLTADSSAAAAEWASSANVIRLAYEAPDNDHGDLHKLLDVLVSARPTEPSASPVVSSAPAAKPIDAFPSAQELRLVVDTNDVRRLLNQRGRELLSKPNGESLFADFMHEYAQAVHAAGFIHPTESSDLLNYRIQNSVAEGAFGRVFYALDEDDQPVAIKVLRDEIRWNRTLTAAFRRGIRAMNILSKRNVSGVVRYLDASEIPAFVAMEWIEGPTLHEARQQKVIADWHIYLWTLRKLAQIIKSAHELPEVVLHRDIRPANVMIRGGWGDFKDWEVVVLDFDLSTYEGAIAKTELPQQSVTDFLSPEQIGGGTAASTRKAAVDSYGFGLTALYLLDGGGGLLRGPQTADFEKRLASAVREFERPEWRSLPKRVADLIAGACRLDANERWPISHLLWEIDRLSLCLDEAAHVTDTDLVCNEIAERALGGRGTYTWSASSDSATYYGSAGLKLTLIAQERSRRVEGTVEWVETGTEDRSSVSKYVAEGRLGAKSQLQKGGWSVTESSGGKRTVRLKFHSAVSRDTDIANLANGISGALDRLQFSG